MTEDGWVPGSCFCGAVRFAIEPPTVFCAHCHCSMCRRSHGAGYVTWFGVLRDRFRIETGEESLTRFASSDHATRSFCRRCGSTLLFESTRHPERVEIVLANMDAAIDRAPDLHCWFDDRVHWVGVEDGLPRLGGNTSSEPVPTEELS